MGISEQNIPVPAPGDGPVLKVVATETPPSNPSAREDPADEKLPESDEKLPENDKKLPESDEKLPESDEKLPENDEKLPENDEKLPENDEKLPKNDESATETTHKDTRAVGVTVAQADESGEERWKSSATLYCRVNGNLHSVLVNFGIPKCPLCKQNLARPSPGPPRPDSRGFASGGKEKADKGRGDADDKPKGAKSTQTPIPEHLKVGHIVEYQDLGGYSIASEDWGHPFQLERERMAALNKGPTKHKETVFQVVTVLRTTVPADKRRLTYEKNAILEQGIIGNSTLSVTVRYTKIVILSRLFVDVLRLVALYDTPDTLESGKLELNEPFSIIGHHLEELEAYVQTDNQGNSNASSGATGETESVDRETRVHVGLVVDFVRPFLRDPIANELARHKRDVPTCTYRMLWYLFRPGDLVYVMSDEGEDAYMVDSVEMDRFCLSSTDIDMVCRIKLWHLDFNGECITRARHETTVEAFKGEREICSLDVVPCEIWDKMDGGKLRKALGERGEKWVSHLMGKQVEYRGEPFRAGKKTIYGRAYADPASYYSLDGNKPGFVAIKSESLERPAMDARFSAFHNAAPYNAASYNAASYSAASHNAASEAKRRQRHTSGASYDNLSVKSIGKVTDDSGRRTGYLLCARKLRGFVFSTRTWETLDIRYCEPSKPDKNPFARLVMPEDKKMMIKALVYKYTDRRFANATSQVWGADFIKNKGEGLVFLLHGGPGVGKTFTAECIAQFTGRPLLALTCGDIGTDEVAMEKKLRGWLQLAYKWGAVMLIDEADVFLEKRMDSDVKRNSLVSVFLREIEYYQGILFLTSNRVGRFDDAIVSRIHVVIQYKSLSDEYRAKIWNQFFDKLEKERGATMKIENSARRYVLENKTMVGMKWNGREIRNAFQTAVALAEYRFLTKPEAEREDGELAVLEEEDFKQICEMTIQFKKYLTEVHEGQDEDMRARADKARHSEC